MYFEEIDAELSSATELYSIGKLFLSAAAAMNENHVLRAENKELRRERDQHLQQSLDFAKSQSALLLKAALAGAFKEPTTCGEHCA